jgi:hypothetical protein
VPAADLGREVLVEGVFNREEAFIEVFLLSRAVKWSVIAIVVRYIKVVRYASKLG